MLGPENIGLPDDLERRDVYPLLVGIFSGIRICRKALMFNYMMP